MESVIHLVTGGQRSGKSAWAQEHALAEARKRGVRPLYLATARVMDGELGARVARHQADRGPEWDLLESPGLLDVAGLRGRVGVIDCLTLWLADLCETWRYDPDAVMQAVRSQWEGVMASGACLQVVSNEINMGLHGLDRETRNFQDIQGWTNQMVAASAASVVLMVAGLPLWVKNTREKGNKNGF